MELREFENSIIEFFTINIPELKNYITNVYEFYDDNEGVGLYILMPYIFKYFEDCVKEKNKNKTKKFLLILNEFRDKFKEDYEKFSTETMDNFIGVAFFEDVIDSFDKDKVKFTYDLFNDKFKSEYENYQEIYNKQLLTYIEYLLKNKNLKLDIKYLNKEKYSFLNKVDKSETLNVTKLINLTEKTFYVIDEKGFCYFGKMLNDKIELIYKDTLPMYLINKLKVEDFE